MKEKACHSGVGKNRLCLRCDYAKFFGIDPKIYVVERSVSNVPAVNTPDRPASSNTKFLMYDNFCAWWVKWCGIEIKGTMNFCMGGEFWIYSGSS